MAIAGWTELDDRAVATARALAADAVQKVGNGHPGTAMALAPAAYLLFQRFLRHDPADPTWIGRDRFDPVVRAQQPHPLHPAVPLRLRDLPGRSKSFRMLGSLTPGTRSTTPPAASR